MRKIIGALLVTASLSACGIVGGSSKEDVGNAFCDRVRTAQAAGVLGGVDGTETADELRAYASAKDAVDYLGTHSPDKIKQATADLVSAYDELVPVLTAAGFDASKVEPATLTDLNGRIALALKDLDPIFNGPCQPAATP